MKTYTYAVQIPKMTPLLGFINFLFFTSGQKVTKNILHNRDSVSPIFCSLFLHFRNMLLNLIMAPISVQEKTASGNILMQTAVEYNEVKGLGWKETDKGG